MNFDPEEMMILREEAERRLQENLSEDERDILQGIRDDFSSSIKWRSLTSVILRELHEMMGAVIADGDHTTLSPETSPLENLEEVDQALLSGGDPQTDLRKEYVSLLLLLKLVGGLKSSLKKRLGEINFLDEDEESELMAFLGDAVESEDGEYAAEGEAIDEEDRVRCPGCYQFHYKEEYAPGTTFMCECGLRLSMPEEEIEDREESLTAKIQSVMGECPHSITRTKIIPSSGKANSSHLYTFCTRCGETLSTRSVSGGRGKKGKKECECLRAEWVPGEEGRNARCSSCQKPIENPETWKWERAGLEPYGDDPTKDEVILL